MRYNQISEAIIKVPNSFLSVLNKYVSSVLCTQLNNSLGVVKTVSTKQNNPELYTTRETEIKKIISAINKKYSGVVLNDSTYQSIINSPITINFNRDEFVNELPMQTTPEIQEAVKRGVYLKILKNGNAGTNGELSVMTNGDINITVIADVETAPLDKNIYQRVQDIMSTVYHESQHYVQHVAIRQISPNNKQLQSSSNIDSGSNEDDWENYLASYIEFGPTLSNFLNKMETTIEIMKANDELGTEPYHKIFKQVLDITVKGDDKYRTFLIALYKKSPERYKIALKKLYSLTNKSFDLIKKADPIEVLSELPYGDLPVDINPIQAAYEKLSNKYKVKAYSKNQKASGLYKLNIAIDDSTSLDLETNGEDYNLTLLSGSVHEAATLSAGQVLSLISSMMYITITDAHLAYSIMMGIERDSEFNTESVQEVLKASYDLCKYNKIETEITSDSILIGSITYEVDVEEDQYVIISPDVSIYLSAKTTSKLQRNLMDLIYATKNSTPEEVKKCIEDNTTGYDLIHGLRNL